MVGMGGGGWKRIAFGGNKERFVRIKGFFGVLFVPYKKDGKVPERF